MKYFLKREKNDLILVSESEAKETQTIITVWEHNGDFCFELDSVFKNETVLFFNTEKKALEIIAQVIREGQHRHKKAKKMRELMSELLTAIDIFKGILEMQFDDELLLNDEKVSFYYPFNNSFDEVIADIETFVDMIEEETVKIEPKSKSTKTSKVADENVELKEQYRELELQYLTLQNKYQELFNITQEYVKAVSRR